MSNKDDKKQTKLKPAKNYASVEKKIQKAREQMQDISPAISSTMVSPEQLSSQSQQTEVEDDMDIIIPVVQHLAEMVEQPPADDGFGEMAHQPVGDIDHSNFQTYLEVSLNKVLDNRTNAQREETERKIREAEAEGKEFLTPENICLRAAGYMQVIAEDCNLYREQKNTIAKEQAEVKAVVAQQAQTASRLETVIGRIEDVQGVKAPRRPPFPSWACLTYLLWHWPMYAFARMWLSKYFRCVCFLFIGFIVMILICLVSLLAIENRTLRYQRTKYVTVRNWSYVMEDTAAVSRFNYVDLLFEDVDFNIEKINELNDRIRTKHEKMMQRKRK